MIFVLLDPEQKLDFHELPGHVFGLFKSLVLLQEV